MKLYFKAGDTHIDDMIELVSRNKQQETLQQTLLDYLLGEIDKPKDPIYLLKYYDKMGTPPFLPLFKMNVDNFIEKTLS